MVSRTKSTRKNLFAYIHRIGLDGFIVGIFAAVLLAYVWPEGGTGDGNFSLSAIATYGVSFIFFFYGLKLSFPHLRAGISNWKLHLLIQCSTFVLFPAIVLIAKPLLPPGDWQLLWPGIFFLASLPSTVSSSVVMVSIAGGNLPAAIFNASISSLIGVFATPLWIGMAMEVTGTGAVDFSDVFGKLILQVLLPVTVGLLLNPRWGKFAERFKQQLRYFDQTVILIIVYTSFSESFARNLFVSIGVVDILVLSAAMLLLFYGVFYGIRMSCNLLHFSREDRVTAVFCGSKKSLVHGTVMSSVLFAGSAVTGLLLLPLMVYHALQLVAASILARGRGGKV